MTIEFLSEGDESACTRSLCIGADSPCSSIAVRVAVAFGTGDRLRIDVAEVDEYCCFQAVRMDGTKAYIGYGERVFIVDSVTEHVVIHHMDGYFCEFFDADELESTAVDFSVLASSASELFAFGRDGGLLWKTTQLGIDGVMVHSASPTEIEGSGEWEPPDGWEPFILSTSTGERICRSSAPSC